MTRLNKIHRWIMSAEKGRKAFMRCSIRSSMRSEIFHVTTHNRKWWKAFRRSHARQLTTDEGDE